MKQIFEQVMERISAIGKFAPTMFTLFGEANNETARRTPQSVHFFVRERHSMRNELRPPNQEISLSVVIFGLPLHLLDHHFFHIFALRG